MTMIFREDEALKALLQGIQVSDGKNPHRPVQVWFTMPDVEVRTQSYPFITIDLIDIAQSKDRQVYGSAYDLDKAGTFNAAAQDIYSYQEPVRWDLYYQITTYARHPRHDRAMLAALLKFKTPGTYGYLSIPNADNTLYENRHMFVENFAKRDTIDDGRRLFRNTITVRILTEMTQDEADNALYIVDNVQITTNSTNVPSDYTQLHNSYRPA